jgi:hypothetical protein
MTMHDKQFKEEAVRLAITSPQPIAKTAHDLGINKTTCIAGLRPPKINLQSLKKMVKKLSSLKN